MSCAKAIGRLVAEQSHARAEWIRCKQPLRGATIESAADLRQSAQSADLHLKQMVLFGL